MFNLGLTWGGPGGSWKKKNRLQSHRNSTLDISRLEVVKVFIKEKHKEEKRKGQGQIYMGGQVDTGSQMRMLARDGAKERRKAQGAQCHGTRRGEEIKEGRLTASEVPRARMTTGRQDQEVAGHP